MEVNESIKLPEDFKKQWIEALESGKYEQGTARLYTNGKYCCLGVACIVAGYSYTELGCMIYPDINHHKNLPSLFFENLEEFAVPLAMMNDGKKGYEKHSFKEIAEYIRENF